MDTVQIFTFSGLHTPVQIEILSNQTIFDLVDIFCKTTSIGYDGECVNAQFWTVSVPGIESVPGIDKTFDSPTDNFFNVRNARSRGIFIPTASDVNLDQLHLQIHMKLIFDYSYSRMLSSEFELINIAPLDPNEDQSSFPRKKKNNAPTSYQVFETTGIDLNVTFSKFDEFIRTGQQVDINLFEPGRKRNHGYCERKNMRVMHMIFLPVKTKPDLVHYLYCFDFASQFKYATDDFDGYPRSSWYSVVVFPEDYNKPYGMYGEDLEPGFCDMIVVPEAPLNIPYLNNVFPKIAALAGFVKDIKVPKGWICYKDKTLTICTGFAEIYKSKYPPYPSKRIFLGQEYPPGTAFVGKEQHKPEDLPLFQIDVEITSLHHLFCVVEGLLRTL